MRKIPPSKMRAMFEEYSSKALRYHQPVKNKTMINTTSTNPSPAAIQRDWSYIEAIHTPLFFDPYTQDSSRNAQSTNLAKEKLAIAYGKHGYTHIKDILHNDKELMTLQQFKTHQSSRNKLPKYDQVIQTLPGAALKAVRVQAGGGTAWPALAPRAATAAIIKAELPQGTQAVLQFDGNHHGGH